MKIPLLKLFTDLLFMILWNDKIEISRQQTPHKCHIFTDERHLSHADCSGKGIQQVPQDMDTNLMVLDISQNEMDDFDSNVFKRYKKLVILRMTSLQKLPKREFIKHNEDIFVPLTSLLDLDLSDSQFIDVPRFIWPLKLERLGVAGIRLGDPLDLSHLAHLQLLNAAHNQLKTFPKLNISAPIYWIDLSGLLVGRSGLLNTASRLCMCLRLEKWMLERNIDGAHTLICFNDSRHGECNTTFDTPMLAQYEECIDKLPSSPLWRLYVYLLLFSLTFPALYIANVTYQSYQKKKLAQQEMSPMPQQVTDGAEIDTFEPEPAEGPDMIAA